jgi:hypothetical protein
MSNNIIPYDAGSVDVNSSGAKILMEMEVHQILLYPTVDATVSLNGESTKEVFLPKAMWTPISISRDFYCTDFVVKSVTAGKVYWQGWVV